MHMFDLKFQVSDKPGRRNLAHIAYKAYAAFSQFFRDEVDGIVVGSLWL